MSLFTKIVLTLLCTSLFAFADTLATSELLSPEHSIYDVTAIGDVDNISSKELVDKILVEVDAITSATPRSLNIENCSATFGCMVDAVKCDAVSDTPFCPSGSILNTQRDMCQKDPDVLNCPDGFVFDSGVGKCIKLPDCPNNGTYSIERQRCESPVLYDCPDGYVVDGNYCVSPPICSNGGVFNPVNMKCEVEANFGCEGSAQGWTYDKEDNICYKDIECVNGTVYNSNLKKCTVKFMAECPAGFVFNEIADRCEIEPSCPDGTIYNSVTNRCEQPDNSSCASVGGTWNGSACVVNNDNFSFEYRKYGERICITTGTTCYYSGEYNRAIYKIFSHDTDWQSAGDTGVIIDTSVAHTMRSEEGNLYVDDTATSYEVVRVQNGVLEYRRYGNRVCNKVGSQCYYSGDYNRALYEISSFDTGWSNSADSGVVYDTSVATTFVSAEGNANTDETATSYEVFRLSNGILQYRRYGERVCNKAGSQCFYSGDYNSVLYDVFSFDTGWNNATSNGVVFDTISAYLTHSEEGNQYIDDTATTYDAIRLVNNPYTTNVASSCPSGYLDDGEGRCYINPTCFNSSSFDGVSDKCYLEAIKNCQAVLGCPEGYSLNEQKDICEKAPKCDSQDVYNSISNHCEQEESSSSCSAGYTKDAYGVCYKLPTCSDNGVLNTSEDLCYIENVSFDSTVNLCVSEPVCEVGTPNLEKDRCEKAYEPQCSSGWSWNEVEQTCERNLECVSGSVYSPSLDKCVADFTKTCPVGYVFNAFMERCEKTPECPSGTVYNSTTKRCEQGVNSACSYVNGNWDGSKCVFTSSGNYAATPSYTCPDGGSLNGTICNKTCTTTENIFCPYTIGLGITCTGGIPGCEPSNGIVFSVSDCGTYPREVTSACDYGASITYSCPSGGVLNDTTCIQTGSSSGPASCGSGYYHDGSGKCFANPTCSSGGVFDSNSDVCYLSYSKRCLIPNSSYDSTADKCLLDADCNGGVLNGERDMCEVGREIVCPSNTLEDLNTGGCTFDSTCLSGGSLDTVEARCLNDKVALECTDAAKDDALDVCYSKNNECLIDGSYVHSDTLIYADIIKACVVDEEVKCASGLTWSETYTKCEAVPICSEGLYNPENNFCYIDDQPCPLDPNLECKGPVNNRWCSPYKCNPKTNQCGYASCEAQGYTSNEEMPKELLMGITQIATDSVCKDIKCSVGSVTRFSYCGSTTVCPQGFGVFSQDGKCYKKECPPQSEEINGECYTEIIK